MTDCLIILHPKTGARFVVPSKWQHLQVFERHGWSVKPEVGISVAELLRASRAEDA